MKNNDGSLAALVRQKFASLELCREDACDAGVDVSNSVIATCLPFLEDAVGRYWKNSSDAPLRIVLADWSGEANSEIEDVVRSHGVQVYPVQKLDALTGVRLCAYCPTENARQYFALTEMLRAKNIVCFTYDAVAVPTYLFSRRGLADYFDKNFSEICEVYSRLADDESRDVFLRSIKAITYGNSGYLSLSPYEQYHHPLVDAALGDTVFEGGLCTGETTHIFARLVGDSGRVYGFEPIGEFAACCTESLAGHPNVIIEAAGLWSGKNSFLFDQRGSASRVGVREGGSGALCPVTSLDAYVAEKRISCDLIKLDVEGAETEALKGAMQTIRRDRPKLQISVYHLPDDYIQIPLTLMRENLGYAFYMGHHSLSFSETCLYATTQPPEKAEAVRASTLRSVRQKRDELQAAADAHARETAKKLAGKQVLFSGAGAALQYYSPLFAQSAPRAIVVSSRRKITEQRRHSYCFLRATLGERQKNPSYCFYAARLCFQNYELHTAHISKR